jgi:hypothetical protein
MWRMLRMVRVLGVFRMVGMRRMVRAARILGWPLLVALTSLALPGRATQRMLFQLHAQMLVVRASNARVVADIAHHIGVTKLSY